MVDITGLGVFHSSWQYGCQVKGVSDPKNDRPSWGFPMPILTQSVFCWPTLPGFWIGSHFFPSDLGDPSFGGMPEIQCDSQLNYLIGRYKEQKMVVPGFHMFFTSKQCN